MTAMTDAASERKAWWRAVLSGPVVALVAMALALVATDAAGVDLRDPDGVASGRLLVAFSLVAALIAVDIIVRAARSEGTRRPSRAAMWAVCRDRWSTRRLAAVVVALLAFFAAYLAYRNIKSVVPLLRPGDSFDHELTELDQGLFGGSDPAELLHSLLGTGISAQGLSIVYTLFFMFIPVSLAMALVFSPRVQAGLFFTTALSINWLVGAGSYFLLPSLGPIYTDPSLFSDLPATPVSALQTLLLEQRTEFVNDPSVASSAQSIGAFASLHMSIYVTAALTAHLLGLSRRIKVTVWTLTGLTAVSTVYFGWHYVLDDVGGVAIAVIALVLARVLTGFDPRTAREETARVPAGLPEAA
jgi:PAP2 superfamily